jgi:soluble lytic murein transglycosylase-like protein
MLMSLFKGKKNSKSNLNKANKPRSGHSIDPMSMGMVLLAIIVVAGSYVNYRISHARMEKLSQDVINLRSAMNIDSVRQFEIQKVMKIIDLHNKNLSAIEAYDIASEIYELSQKYPNLNVELICAMITHESAGTWSPTVVSKANAMGLMQIMPVTGYFLAEYEGITWDSAEGVLFNPIYNLRIGTRLLSTLITRYGLDGALAAYNGGEKQAAIWLANGRDDKYLVNETRGYVPAVQRLYTLYKSQNL